MYLYILLVLFQISILSCSAHQSQSTCKSSPAMHQYNKLEDAAKFSNKLAEKVNLHLGTKTPYRFIRNNNDKELKYKDCKAIRIWSIIRHGSRNPNKRVINQMQSRLVRIRDRIIEHKSFSDKILDAFHDWKSDLRQDEAKYLVYEGIDELVELGERMQNRLPYLLSDIYENKTYKFKFTDTQRTRKSYESFATGLFGRNNIINIWFAPPLQRDPVLRFYKLCSRWSKEVDKNQTTLTETNLWTTSEYFQNILKTISNKIGISDLTTYDLNLIYTVCAFETAWDKYTASPWCLLFDDAAFAAMEFSEDLEYYWIDGYGYELTHRQACPAIIDLFEHIDPSSTQPNATFYFTHSGTILKMLAHLGLYKDDYVLTHKHFETPRKWKVSKIDAFASNLAFVLFDCSNGPHILAMHQEQIIHMPGCPPGKDLCHLDLFRKNYENSLQNCEFDEMCRL